MLKAPWECFFYFLTSFYLANSLFLSATCFIYFRLCDWSANLLPLIVLHLCCFFNSLFLLWLICNGSTLHNNLFREEISACAAVHTHYVIGACNHVQPIILLPPMMETSFMLVALTRLIVSKPKHRVTWSHRTCVNFPFLRGERIQYFSVSA